METKTEQHFEDRSISEINEESVAIDDFDRDINTHQCVSQECQKQQETLTIMRMDDEEIEN